MRTRPRVGDIWEFKLPGKPKRQKQVGKVQRVWVSKYDQDQRWIGQKRIVYVHWYRLPKGRYSGIRVKTLLKHGLRISTQAERDAAREERWQEMMKRRPPRKSFPASVPHPKKKF